MLFLVLLFTSSLLRLEIKAKRATEWLEGMEIESRREAFSSFVDRETFQFAIAMRN